MPLINVEEKIEEVSMDCQRISIPTRIRTVNKHRRFGGYPTHLQL